MIPGLFTLKGYLVTGAVTLAVGFGAGWTVRDAFADRREALRNAQDAQEALAATQVALRRLDASQAVSATIGEASAKRQVEIRNTTHEIIREVPVYVTREADAGCVVPRGFVSVHDKAASGSSAATVPDPAEPSHDAPSGTSLSTVAATVAENYGVCHAELARLSDLQNWIRAQQAAWSK